MRVYETSLTYRCVGRTEFKKIDTPERAVAFLKDAFESHPHQEALYVIHLDRKHHAMGRHLITLGTATSSLAHPREVFRSAIIAGACSIILAHNHPSGDPAPSSADIAVTRQIREASRTIDISLLDHVIVGDPEADPVRKGHYSFREAGLI
ncbi:RadC family protein [Nibricoccus sp. IMCC34717]|uniref:JAB domain-containing protein n=1 Tax=Nibricoccus sp. IMCC34717 TaxID=3034021 RepID=UPI00384AE500